MLTQPSEIAGFTQNGYAPTVKDLQDLFANKDNNNFAAKALSIFSAMQQNLKEAQTVIAEQQEEIMALEKVADTDFMTGLANRRQFERAFAVEVDRINRGHSAGGLLVMIDLDNFKQINDTFGHQAGDECLKCVADFLNESVRTFDTAARLGGDEYVVIFADTNAELAIGRAQEMAVALNKLSIEWEGETIDIRASVGLKDFNKGATIESIMSAADNTLYEDKKQNKQKEELITTKEEDLNHQLFKGEISVLTLHQ
ncbi:MAG: GGDEF domain-containing protein [Pseudomonadota bacterium]|jgi:diguanylate cyclase (GGDEF)-like protein|nr:GGDEF domain-containing protein [Pseudomonadota bacterium]MEC7703271.1 GGDEF domain-containing protein [Pseudomonadota bacterium]